MGVGKTTNGLKLARALNFDFIDLDAHIVDRMGKSVKQIFDEDGETYFRSIEAENLRLLGGRENVVVSLGGGTPCFHNNMKWLNDSGLTVYLKLDSKSIYSRLSKAKSERPLISNRTESEIYEYIESTLLEREAWYEQSKIVVEAINLNTKKLVSIVKDNV